MYLLIAVFPVGFVACIYLTWVQIRFGFQVVWQAVLQQASWTRWMYAILFLYMCLWLARAPRRGPEVIGPVPELISSVAMLFYFALSNMLYSVRPDADIWRKW